MFAQASETLMGGSTLKETDLPLVGLGQNSPDDQYNHTAGMIAPCAYHSQPMGHRTTVSTEQISACKGPHRHSRYHQRK